MLDHNIVQQQVTGIKKDRSFWLSKISSDNEYYGLSDTEFADKMKTKYTYLHDNAITLFTKCINGEINEHWFSIMIEKMKQINSGSVSYFDGSKQIGEILTDHYVKPLISDKK